MPIVQERAKRGPKPYAPPQPISEACQERLATSLRELIPYLNRNLRPARPPAPGGKYAKHARPNVKIPDLNNAEIMLKTLEKLLDSNWAFTFQSFVVTIARDRNRLGKRPAFQETAEKKLGDGNINDIEKPFGSCRGIKLKPSKTLNMRS
jgi:hypothetical protein